MYIVHCTCVRVRAILYVCVTVCASVRLFLIENDCHLSYVELKPDENISLSIDLMEIPIKFKRIDFII